MKVAPSKWKDGEWLEFLHFFIQNKSSMLQHQCNKSWLHYVFLPVLQHVQQKYRYNWYCRSFHKSSTFNLRTDTGGLTNRPAAQTSISRSPTADGAGSPTHPKEPSWVMTAVRTLFELHLKKRMKKISKSLNRENVGKQQNISVSVMRGGVRERMKGSRGGIGCGRGKQSGDERGTQKTEIWRTSSFGNQTNGSAAENGFCCRSFSPPPLCLPKPGQKQDGVLFVSHCFIFLHKSNKSYWFIQHYSPSSVRVSCELTRFCSGKVYFSSPPLCLCSQSVTKKRKAVFHSQHVFPRPLSFTDLLHIFPCCMEPDNEASPNAVSMLSSRLGN